MDKRAPDWFYQAVSGGLQALIVLHLPGAPGHETVAYTEEVWVEALWSANIAWSADLDVSRLHEAFLRLVRQVERWPAPRTLLELLPERPQPRRLAAPRITPAEAAAGRARLAELLARLTKRRSMP